MSETVNIFQSFNPDPSVLNIRLKNILAGMSMKEEHADDYLLDMISGLIKQCKEICEPQASYSIYKSPVFETDNKTIKIKGASFDTGKQVLVSLKKSESLVLFVCTIGHETEKLSKKLMKEGHSLEGLIVDLIGSELAEETAEFIHYEAEKIAEKNGLKITNRYSPGYCNWPVSDQFKLFSLMHDKCGVELTPSSLMLPIKSVSGMFGMGHEVKKVAYKCKLCSDTDCILRNRDL